MSKTGKKNSKINRGKIIQDSPRSGVLGKGLQPLSEMRVLIADDEPFICNLIGNILKEHFNFEVDKVQNGSDAIVMALSNEYNIILIDLVMPNTSGIKAINAIKSMKPGIPIIAMSGGQYGYSQQAQKNNAYDKFIKKPFSISHLINEVNELLNYQKDRTCSSYI
jgi:DNA-binding NtrC family response regulator